VLIADGQQNKYIMSNKKVRVIVLICSISISLKLATNTELMNGYKYLFVIPILFGLYYSFSQLANTFLKNLPLSVFSMILMIRYLITPLIMNISNEYSATFNGANTYYSQQIIGIELTIYEMVFMFVTIELCMHFIYTKTNKIISKENINKRAFNYPNIIYIISMGIGLLGLLLYPNLLEGFNILFVKTNLNISNEKTIAMIFSYFLEFIQVFIFIIVVKYSLYRKTINRRYSLILLLIVSIINITFMWSSNRMSIFIVAGTTLVILLYAFPERKKFFYLMILSISIIMVVLLSNYRLFGIVGSQINTEAFGGYFNLKNFSTQLQIYFAGPDSVAAAVATKEFYSSAITVKTFLNDTFIGVRFIQSLPIFKYDSTNSTVNYFNLISCNGYNMGLIIPMIGQGYAYFGFLLSPVFTVFSTILLFLSERKAKSVKDIGLKYVFAFLTFNFVIFPMYNYTLMMQNVFGRIIPLFLIVWVNQYIYVKSNITHTETRFIKIEKEGNGVQKVRDHD
jgi:hypothetical protein